MNTKNAKIQKLLSDTRSLYHTQDLAVLWDITNKNTLYTTIKRCVNRDILKRIYKGFYTIRSLNKINPIQLGLSALHRFGYLSTESILVENGIIFQDIKYITLVSDISRRFKIGGNSFLVRKMKEDYLFNSIGINTENGIRKASPERAVVDLLYFNPDYHFDARDRVNWDRVKEIKKQIYDFSE